MLHMGIILEGDDAWPELAEKKMEGTLVHVEDSITVARLARGMHSGNSSVCIRLDLPDGKTVLAQTSMALFLGAADAFRAREEMENGKN